MFVNKEGSQKLIYFVILTMFVFAILRFTAFSSSVRGNLGAIFLNGALTATSYTTSERYFGLAGNFLVKHSDSNRGSKRSRLAGLYYLMRGEEERGVEALSLAGENAFHFVTRGNQAAEKLRLDSAANWYLRAARIAPDLADPWYFLGLLFENQNLPSQAINAYKRGLTTSQFEKTGRSDFLLHLGLVNFRQYDPPELLTALKVLDEAIAEKDFKADNMAAAYFARGTVFQRLSRPLEAKRDFRWLVDNAPANYWAYVWLASLLWNTEGAGEEAEQLLLSAIEVNENVTKAYHDLIVLYAQTGQHSKALDMYHKLLLLNPDDTTRQQALQALKD